MADEDLKAELERLRKENASLKKGASSNVRMKVSEKGAFPTTWNGRDGGRAAISRTRPAVRAGLKPYPKFLLRR